MKLEKILNYIKTLAQVKRNFASEVAEEEGEGAEKWQGRAEAYSDVIHEIEAIEGDIIEKSLDKNKKPFWDRDVQNQPTKH